MHEGQGIAVRRVALAQPIVERELTVHHLVFEVDVGAARAQTLSNRGQREVVGGDDADRAEIHQELQDSVRTLDPVVGVGSVEELVHEKEQRDRSSSDFNQMLDSQDLRIESRPSSEQGVLDTECSPDRDR